MVTINRIEREPISRDPELQYKSIGLANRDRYQCSSIIFHTKDKRSWKASLCDYKKT